MLILALTIHFQTILCTAAVTDVMVLSILNPLNILINMDNGNMVPKSFNILLNKPWYQGGFSWLFFLIILLVVLVVMYWLPLSNDREVLVENVPYAGVYTSEATFDPVVTASYSFLQYWGDDRFSSQIIADYFDQFEKSYIDFEKVYVFFEQNGKNRQSLSYGSFKIHAGKANRGITPHIDAECIGSGQFRTHGQPKPVTQLSGFTPADETLGFGAFPEG